MRVDSSVTQTKPPPTAIPAGPSPTRIVSTTRFAFGSILETLCPSTFTAQIEPAPKRDVVLDDHDGHPAVELGHCRGA